MSREIKRTSQFKKDVKLMLRQGRQLKPLLDVVEMLQNDIPLPPERVCGRIKTLLLETVFLVRQLFYLFRK